MSLTVKSYFQYVLQGGEPLRIIGNMYRMYTEAEVEINLCSTEDTSFKSWCDIQSMTGNLLKIEFCAVFVKQGLITVSTLQGRREK